MKAIEILKKLEEKKMKGFQLFKRRGILTSTWLLYQKNNFIYFFDINDKIEFNDNHKYSEEEFLEEFKNSHFEIDCTIT
jgi:hypothetical protein